jgi:hypothetical protein
MKSIAFKSGFTWQTLWNLPENAQLKRQREPNVLLPGDRVTIPALRLREEACATDKSHKFQLLGGPSRFKVRFLDEKQKPRSGLAYILTIDGQTTNGTLDGEGGLNVPIPPDAAKGSIQLQTDPEPETYSFDFGHLDPDSTPTGVRGRLNNLGFACASDGDWDADLRNALQRYQISRDIEPTGELDDNTRQALKRDHKS